MRRVHLFEIQDQPWCPASIRDGVTDTIQFGLTLFNLYGPIYPLILQAIKDTGSSRILDLGSGGGGPWPRLWRVIANSGSHIEVFLSDKYPNIEAFRRVAAISEGTVYYLQMPVGLLAIPAQLDGFRTIFSAFHHYRPREARAILEDSIHRQQGIGVFELTSRHPLSFLFVFAMPLFAILSCLFIRPFRLSRLLWTYLIPAAPIAGFLDGIVSCLRTYSTKEMKDMVESLPPNNYHWEIGQARTWFLGAPINYMIGYPKPQP